MTDAYVPGAAPNERTVYLNGEYVPESRAVIHISDRGFIFGDAAFDTARTFGGNIFRLKDHIERLYRSLRYLLIDPGLSPAELTAITEDVVERNRSLLGPDDDYWVMQRISRGSNFPGEPGSTEGPTVAVLCNTLPLKARASLFRGGVDVAFPPTRRTPPECLDPNAKLHNYLNLIVAENEVQAANPGAWTILLDTRGFLNEGNGSNIFIVRDGIVTTPRERYVLPGVSRKVALELCLELAIPFREADISPYDAANAQEAFITSTSLCICPVRSFQSRAIGKGEIPGPVTKRLMDGFAEKVGCDYVAQYLRHLDG